MAEKSLLWTTGATGDGASAYTQSELFALFSRMMLLNQATQGVIANYLTELTINTGTTASPITVASGAAFVCGIPYLNDATKNLTVTTPVVGTTGYQVVLRADYTAQTVRAVLKGSADGTAAPPALTQTANSLWEISLATFTISTAGFIANWVDYRQASLISPQGQLTFFSNSGVVKLPYHVESGTSNLPNGVTTTFTFSKAFSVIPAVNITPWGAGNQYSNVYVGTVTTTGFTVTNNHSGFVQVSYIALGRN